MKKLYLPGFILLFLALLLPALQSCKKNGFLAPAAVSNLNQSTVFVDSAYTNQFLASIYSQIGMDVSANEFGNGGIDAACDESEPSGSYSSDATAWQSGTIGATNVTGDLYSSCYKQIRAINQFLANIHLTKLTLPANAPGSRIQLIGEAHFLRAWYYAMLLKHYGGVPIVYNNLYNYTDYIPVKRATYATCVNYILTECDSAAKVLPLVQSGTQYGRASKGACMALKARVLLYAASPLFNGTTLVSEAHAPTNLGSYPIDSLNMLVGYPTYDANRWKQAADAAGAVIQTGAYQLYVDNSNPSRPGNGFQALFCQRGYLTQEYILQWMLPGNAYGQQLEAFWDPPSRSGSNGATPFQETVDAFPMKDGKAINDPTSAYTYDPSNPYANRDPRMNFSIIHDKTVLPVRAQPGVRTPVDIYQISDPDVNKGAEQPFNGDCVPIGTKTGYYTNKMLDTNATSTSVVQITQRCQPLMRFAEVLLNYAEAKNEYAGPGGTADSVYSILKLIRQRAGVDPGSDGMFGLKPNMSQAEMRAAIQLERRLELAYEGFRFFDVRRWKIAPTTESGTFHGMDVLHVISRDAQNNITGTTIKHVINPVLPAHSFSPRMYLWPFPQSEINKSTQLIQNPGY